MGIIIDRWLGRLSSLWTFAGPVVPGTVGGIAVGWASQGVSWINQFGAFGWFSSGLLAFFVTNAGLALATRTKLWKLEIKSKNRLIGDSSPFDPMARVYENKRLYLRDLAPLGRKEVVKKKFVNCEVIGPGTVLLGLRSNSNGPFPEMKDSSTFDVDAVEINDTVRSHLAIAFYDCDFDGCKFYHMTILFHERLNETLTWITKPTMPPPVLDDLSGE